MVHLEGAQPERPDRRAMKNWRSALLLAALCVTTLLSSLTTMLVLSSAFLPVDEWLTAVATGWKVPTIVRRRWTHTRRRLWRRMDAVLRGDASTNLWSSGSLVRDEVAEEFAPDDSDDDDDDDDCLGIHNDWKHGRICLISH